MARKRPETARQGTRIPGVSKAARKARKADYSNRFRQPTGAHPRPSPKERARRAAISRGMKRYLASKAKFRDSRGRFSRHLFYGVRDVREKASDDVDYEVPFVLAQDTEPEPPYRDVEETLDAADESYANFNVRIFADHRPLVERIMERQGIGEADARKVIHAMEDEARESDDNVSLVDPVPRGRRSEA